MEKIAYAILKSSERGTVTYSWTGDYSSFMARGKWNTVPSSRICLL